MADLGSSAVWTPCSAQVRRSVGEELRRMPARSMPGSSGKRGGGVGARGGARIGGSGGRKVDGGLVGAAASPILLRRATLVAVGTDGLGKRSNEPLCSLGPGLVVASPRCSSGFPTVKPRPVP